MPDNPQKGAQFQRSEAVECEAHRIALHRPHRFDQDDLIECSACQTWVDDQFFCFVCDCCHEHCECDWAEDIDESDLEDVNTGIEEIDLEETLSF